MFLWNRREIYCGCSTKEFHDVRDILAAKRIQFDTRIVNQNIGRSRTRMYGTFGSSQPSEVQYYVYVHKHDYEHAKHVLKK